MDERHKKILKKKFKDLTTDLRPDDVVDHLIQEDIFDFNDVELVRAEKVNKLQVEKLLSILSKRGPNAFRVFLESLEERYPWLYKDLKKADEESAVIQPQPRQQQPQPSSSSSEASSSEARHPEQETTRPSSGQLVTSEDETFLKRPPQPGTQTREKAVVQKAGGGSGPPLTGKKKKKTKTKGQTMSLNDFLGDAATTSYDYVMGMDKDWADKTEGLDYNPTPTLSDSGHSSAIDRAQLPTAPRSAMMADYDAARIPDKPPYTVFLENLSYDVDEEAIERFFRNLKLVTIRLPREDSGRLKGFGYAEFEDKDSLLKAIGMDKEKLLNRQIRIDVADQTQQGVQASEPMEVELGGEEMKALYDLACEQGNHLVFNTLLMLVGKHGNGKSSLHDSLLQLEFNEHQPSTDGIMMTPCLMTGKEKWTITKEIGDKNADFLHALRTEMDKKRKEMEDIEEETKQPGLGPRPLQTDPSTKGHMEEAASSQRRPIEDSRSFKLATSTGISRDLSHIVGSKERPAISIWDFAGHGIYYSNHHVLYTHYAIYILTLNLMNPLSADLKPQSTEEEDQSGICAEALQLKTEGDLVDYHLESIRAHTRPKKRDLKDGDQAEDDKRDREPTVIVVGTHKDQVMTKTITTFRADIKAHLKGKAINKHVYDRCFAIDNTKRDPEDPELSELRDAILNIAQEQNHVGRRIPISWLEMKSELIEMTKQGRPYCSLQDVIDATDHSRVPEGFTPEENAVIILRFFHLCGDILYFDTPELRNFVVLDPQWFVDVQKTIITIPEYRRDGKPTQWDRLEDEGVLEGTLVDAVWGNKKKQEDLKCDLIAYKDELLKMMEQFDLVLQCSPESEDGTSTATSADTTYFVPSLLTAATEEAKLFPKGTNRSKPIFVDFNDKFFPIGLYHRLVIACMRRYKRKPPLAYANCARFVTNNRRQTFVITKERHYLKVELLSSVKEESARFSHGPAVRECLDEDLRRIIGDWIPGIGYKWCFGCFCEEHKEMEREENRFIPILSEEVEEWFEEGEAVCDQFEPATTTIKDIGLAHWYLKQDEYAEQRSIVLPQASSDDAVAQEMANMQLSNRQHMTVPPEVDSEPVTERQLNTLAGKLGSDWENLAIHLDLAKPDVDRYKADNPYNARSQIFSMLMGWRAKKGSGATVGALIRNLEDFGVALDTFKFLTQKT